jgi:hypothetical protein
MAKCSRCSFERGGQREPCLQDHVGLVGGQPWAHLLIPHNAANEAKTGLAAAYTLKAPKSEIVVQHD